MRNAEDFIREYRKRGYSDPRIRVIANLTREPLRGEVLSLLDRGVETGVKAEAVEDIPVATPVEDIPFASPATEPAAEPMPADAPAEARPQSPRRRARRAEKRVVEPAPITEVASGEPESAISPPEPPVVRRSAKKQRIAAEVAFNVSQSTDSPPDVAEQTAQEAPVPVSEEDKDAILECAQRERNEALRRADELVQRIAEHDTIVADLREKIVQRDRQLKDVRGGSDASVARFRPDSDGLRRRVSLYRKLTAVSACTALVLLAFALLPLFVLSGRVQAGRRLDASGAATISSAAETLDANAFAGPVVTPVAATARPTADVVVSAYPTTQSASDNVLTGMTTRGAQVKSQISDLRSQIVKVAPVAASPSSGGRTIMYTIRKGDSLWKICKEQLGDSNQMNRVAQENNIADPARLKPGSQLKLTVPDRGADARPARPGGGGRAVARPA